MDQPLRPGVPLFKFPRSRLYAGTIGHTVTNQREMRIHLNALLHLPCDNPLYEDEIEAIRNWESMHGVTYIPGSGMALYDAGLEGVRE